MPSSPSAEPTPTSSTHPSAEWRATTNIFSTPASVNSRHPDLLDAVEWDLEFPKDHCPTIGGVEADLHRRLCREEMCWRGRQKRLGIFPYGEKQLISSREHLEVRHVRSCKFADIRRQRSGRQRNGSAFRLLEVRPIIDVRNAPH